MDAEGGGSATLSPKRKAEGQPLPLSPKTPREGGGHEHDGYDAAAEALKENVQLQPGQVKMETQESTQEEEALASMIEEMEKALVEQKSLLEAAEEAATLRGKTITEEVKNIVEAYIGAAPKDVRSGRDFASKMMAMQRSTVRQVSRIYDARLNLEAELREREARGVQMELEEQAKLEAVDEAAKAKAEIEAKNWDPLVSRGGLTARASIKRLNHVWLNISRDMQHALTAATLQQLVLVLSKDVPDIVGGTKGTEWLASLEASHRRRRKAPKAKSSTSASATEDKRDRLAAGFWAGEQEHGDEGDDAWGDEHMAGDHL